MKGHFDMVGHEKNVIRDHTNFMGHYVNLYNTFGVASCGKVNLGHRGSSGVRAHFEHEVDSTSFFTSGVNGISRSSLLMSVDITVDSGCLRAQWRR